MKRALLLIDIQNDFCPGGSLAVPHGDEVVAIASRLQELFRTTGGIVIATQDWHPRDHGSFASNNAGKKVFEVGTLDGLSQVMWPDHCVQGTKGAEIHAGIDLHGVTIFRKGTDPSIDSYSAFFDNGHKKSTGLSEWLNYMEIDKLYIMGLATDFCVKASVIDALRCSFIVNVITDGCRGVEMNAGDCDRAMREMKDAGALMSTANELTKALWMSEGKTSKPVE